MNWHEANQRYLAAALDRVAGLLRLAAGEQDVTADEPTTGTATALDALCATFDLTPFERDVLLLCAGMELKGKFAQLCAAAQGDLNRPYPSFGLALAALPDAHWSALAPGSPLRRWRLIEVGAGSLTQSAIRIDEPILHYLTGIADTDARLADYLEPLRLIDDLVPSQLRVAEQIGALMQKGDHPAIQLCGEDAATRRQVAAKAYALAGMDAAVISASLLPSAPAELETLARLLERESLLTRQGIILEADGERLDAPIARLIDRLNEIVILSAQERLPLSNQASLGFDVRQPSRDELRLIWRTALDPQADVNGQLEAVISQFSLSPSAIQAVSAEVVSADALWEACRAYARPQLDDLAQRIETHASWLDLVLPEAQLQVLREIALHVRQRATVYETWGFGARSPRGLGISALFAGQSGTGKTLAAEVLANELRLDLYRIDLSQVVSKYIGETEKNLHRIFDHAEGGGVILLFDEADALFGKRSEVKDSHDRYANIEVSYLLQRMETYRGLAILTTNLKGALDTAFLRRIRFVVQFPFPDLTDRAEIWRRIFPSATPTLGLDYSKLARLNVAGGNIRNIALNAAFLAADAGEPVGMRHLSLAARGEYAKLEKALTEAEIGGWL